MTGIGLSRSTLELAAAVVIVGLALWSARAGAVRPGWRGLLTSGFLLLALYAGPVTRAVERVERILLVTEGFDPSKLETALETSGSLPVYAVGVEPPAESGGRVTVAPNAGFVGRRTGSGATIDLYGWGLEASEWAQVSGSVRQRDRPLRPFGLRVVDWSRRIELGRPLRVVGALGGLAGRGAELELHGPSGLEDETVIKGTDDGLFELAATPKSPGRQTYRLVATQDDGTAASWPVDVVVEVAPSAAVLWLQAAPSFEERAYRALAVRNGGELLSRTELAPGRVRWDAVGRPAVEVRLDAEGLEELDLTVLSAGFPASMGDSLADSLMEAAESGLGLIVLADSADFVSSGASPFTGGLTIRRLGDGAEYQPRLSWASGSRSGRIGLPGRELELSGGWAPLVLDEAGRVQVARRSLGRGKVVVSLVPATYRWRLEGSPELHESFWSVLVAASARSRGGEVAVEPLRGPVLLDGPTDLSVRAAGLPRLDLRTPSGQAYDLSLRANPFVAGSFESRFWPSAPGWFAIDAATSPAGQTLPVRGPAASAGPDPSEPEVPRSGVPAAEFLVTDAALWPGLAADRRLAASRSRAVGLVGSGGEVEASALRRSRLWPQLVAYLLLLAVWARLWLTRSA